MANRKKQRSNVVSKHAREIADRLVAEVRQVLEIDQRPVTHRAIFDAMADGLRAAVRDGRAYFVASYKEHLTHAQTPLARRAMLDVSSVRAIFSDWASTLESPGAEPIAIDGATITFARASKHGATGLCIAGLPGLAPLPDATLWPKADKEGRSLIHLLRLIGAAFRKGSWSFADLVRRANKNGIHITKHPVTGAVVILIGCGLAAAIANFNLYQQDPQRQGQLAPANEPKGTRIAQWMETAHAQGRGEVTREKDGSYQLTYYPNPEPRRLPDLSNIQYEWFLVDEPNGPRMKVTTAEPMLRRARMPAGIHVHAVEYVGGSFHLDMRDDGLVAITDSNGAPLTRYAREVRTRDGFGFTMGNPDYDVRELTLGYPSLPVLDRAQLAKTMGALDFSYTGTTDTPQVQEPGVVWGECLATTAATTELQPQACERVQLASVRRDDLAVIEGRTFYLRSPRSIAARPIIRADWQVCHTETDTCEIVGDQTRAVYRAPQSGTYVVYASFVGLELTKHHASPTTSAKHGHSLLVPYAAFHQRIHL